MTASGFIIAPRTALGAEPSAPAARPRVVGKGAEPRPFMDALQQAEAVTQAAPAKPIGPTDPLRHAVFLSKTLRRA